MFLGTFQSLFLQLSVTLRSIGVSWNWLVGQRCWSGAELAGVNICQEPCQVIVILITIIITTTLQTFKNFILILIVIIITRADDKYLLWSCLSIS